MRFFYVIFFYVCLFCRFLLAVEYNAQWAMSIFPKNAQKITLDATNVVIDCRHKLQKICDIPLEKRTFKNTLEAFDLVWQKFAQTYRVVKLLSTTSTSQKMRRTSREAFIMLAKQEKDLFENKDILDVFKIYIDKIAPIEHLTKEQKDLIGLFKERGRRLGLGCSVNKWSRIVDLRKNIAANCLLFRTNVWDAKKTISFSIDAASIDEECIKNLSVIKGFGVNKGKIRIPLSPQAASIILNKCSDASVRRMFYIALQNQVWPVNMPILDKILQQRKELAHLLGYKSYADFDTEPTMVHTCLEAKDFTTAFLNNLKPSLQYETNIIQKKWNTLGDLSSNVFDPWNYKYARSLCKHEDNMSTKEAFSHYFPLIPTVQKILTFMTDRLGLVCEWQKNVFAWGPDIFWVKIKKQETGRTIGFLFLDLCRREHKIGDPRSIILKFAGKKQPTISALIANFKRTSANRPCCLSHKNIKTLLHELGHALHMFLNRSSLYFYSSYFKGRDFSEGVAQLFERFAFNQGFLEEISRHYRTNKKVPHNILTSVLASNEHWYAGRLRSMCEHSLQALWYHDEHHNKDTDKINKIIHERYVQDINYIDNIHPQTHFLHLTSYGAQYYCYLLARGIGGALYSFLETKPELSKERWKRFVNSLLTSYWRADQRLVLAHFLEKKLSHKDFLSFGLKVM